MNEGRKRIFPDNQRPAERCRRTRLCNVSALSAWRREDIILSTRARSVFSPQLAGHLAIFVIELGWALLLTGVMITLNF